MIDHRKNKSDYSGLTETEKRFSELLMQASENEFQNREEQFKPVNYSFMNEITEKEVKQKSKSFRILKIAAIFLLCVSFSICGAIWMNSQQAQAMKFKLEQVMIQIGVGQYSNLDDVEMTENETIITVRSLKEAERLRKMSEHLLLPAYLPDGVEVTRVELTKDNAENIFVTTDLVKEGKEIGYILQISIDDDKTVEYSDVTQVIKKEDRTIYVCEDPVAELCTIEVIIGNETVSILGDLSLEEKIKIAEELF